MRLAAVVLPDRALDRLVRACDLPFALAPADATLDDGALVRLESRRGSAIGLAIVDRAGECWRLMTRAGEPWTSLGEAWLDARLDAALAWRTAAGLVGPDATFRLVHGAGDALPGLYVDVYGAFAVASALTPALRAGGRRAGATAGGPRPGRGRGGEASRPRRRRRSRPRSWSRSSARPRPSGWSCAKARGDSRCTWRAGVNVGLFGDMRAERLRLAGAGSAGRRVLNLFAYTGTLSVAAATGGASTSPASICRRACSPGPATTPRSTTCPPSGTAPWPPTPDASSARPRQSASRSTSCWSIRPASRRPATPSSRSIATTRGSSPRSAGWSCPPACCGWPATRAASRWWARPRPAPPRPAAGRRSWRVGLLPPDHPTELADADARYLQTCLLRLT